LRDNFFDLMDNAPYETNKTEETSKSDHPHLTDELEGSPNSTIKGVEESKIFSLYIRPSCRLRLGIIKKWLDLSYSDTLDLLLGHMIEENILPEEAVKELNEAGLFKDQDREELNILGIEAQWPKAAKIVEDIKLTHDKISAQLDELINCIEDHAEAIIINNKDQ
jgi:hypothetical protein